jgi:hypothetical protein
MPIISASTGQKAGELRIEAAGNEHVHWGPFTIGNLQRPVIKGASLNLDTNRLTKADYNQLSRWLAMLPENKVRIKDRMALHLSSPSQELRLTAREFIRISPEAVIMTDLEVSENHRPAAKIKSAQLLLLPDGLRIHFIKQATPPHDFFFPFSISDENVSP